MKPLKSSAPPTSLLSPEFRYVPAAATNIAETFARAKAVKCSKCWIGLSMCEDCYLADALEAEEYQNRMRQVAREGRE